MTMLKKLYLAMNNKRIKTESNIDLLASYKSLGVWIKILHKYLKGIYWFIVCDVFRKLIYLCASPLTF